MKDLLLQLIDSRIKDKLFLGTVKSVDNNTCKIEVLESKEEVFKAGLTSVFENLENRLVLVPKIGSIVLFGILGNKRAVILQHSDIEKIEWTQGNLTANIAEQEASLKLNELILAMKNGKFTIKNGTASLGEILSDGFNRLDQSVITTPSGPGNFSPADKLIFQQLKQKAEQLFDN